MSKDPSGLNSIRGGRDLFFGQSNSNTAARARLLRFQRSTSAFGDESYGGMKATANHCPSPLNAAATGYRCSAVNCSSFRQVVVSQRETV